MNENQKPRERFHNNRIKTRIEWPSTRCTTIQHQTSDHLNQLVLLFAFLRVEFAIWPCSKHTFDFINVFHLVNGPLRSSIRPSGSQLKVTRWIKRTYSEPDVIQTNKLCELNSMLNMQCACTNIHDCMSITTGGGKEKDY